MSSKANDPKDILQLKRSLNLNFLPSQNKRVLSEKYCRLTTPDLAKLAVSTPDLETMARNFSPSKTPSTFIRNGTDGLHEFFNQNRNTPATNYAVKSIKIENDLPIVEIKSDPDQSMDTVNPVEPIDMADQERIKLERKRHRNRIAASKCRQRKLIRISKLEKKVDKYNSKISNLKNWNQIIQDALAKLNSHIAAHRNAGCEISLVMSS